MKQMAQTFKALSDETRLRILVLLTRGELCVCDLMAVLGLPQSTVSRHLAYLRNAGLVSDRREGVWMYYCLVKHPSTINGSSLADLLEQCGQKEQAAVDFAALELFLAEKNSEGCS